MKVLQFEGLNHLRNAIGFSSTIDFILRQKVGERALVGILQDEAQTSWNNIWMKSSIRIRDPQISDDEEKRLWANYELMKSFSPRE
jgi:hypothetical protein